MMPSGNFEELVRCFAAVPVDSVVLEAIKNTQHRLDRRCQSSGIKWVNPRQIHLTLRFFGNVPSSRIDDLKSALEIACRGVAPFVLKAENIGCFPAWDRPRVIWAGLAGDLTPLMTLHANVNAHTQIFGDNSESQDFKPHLTLGRVKTNSTSEARNIGEKVRTVVVEPLGQWNVTRLHLVKSRLTPQGPEYENLSTMLLSS